MTYTLGSRAAQTMADHGADDGVNAHSLGIRSVSHGSPRPRHGAYSGNHYTQLCHAFSNGERPSAPQPGGHPRNGPRETAATAPASCVLLRLPACLPRMREKIERSGQGPADQLGIHAPGLQTQASEARVAMTRPLAESWRLQNLRRSFSWSS